MLMLRKRLGLILALVLLISAGAYYIIGARPTDLALTGIVTTNDVIVSPQIAGQISKLLVDQGDTVTRGQLLAVISPDELKADREYYDFSAQGLTSQVQESEAALRYQERQTKEQIDQAEATLASTMSQQKEALASLDNAQTTFNRQRDLLNQKVVSPQEFDQARTTLDGAKARVETLNKQIEASRAAVAMAHANAEQIAMRRSQLATNQRQHAAAEAQRAKADVRLAYTELHAPIDGIVDKRVARPGEVVGAGQAVITLVNPDDLWVRADVEETYIDRIKLGDKLTVRFPSGDERQGVVIYRSVDAGYATQRDVSRTKRDIKTFEIRLRVDNKDRHMALGMTATVLLPVSA
jgi:HlyD family secretion protein